MNKDTLDNKENKFILIFVFSHKVENTDFCIYSF